MNGLFPGKCMLTPMPKGQPDAIAIIGQGYVGLPLAMSAVKAGWKVFGVDLDVEKIKKLREGISPVEDILNKEVQSALNQGLYEPTIDFGVLSQAKVVAICVPTPLDNSLKPDLSLLRSAAMSIAPHLARGTLLVSESTSFPGTLRNFIIPLIMELEENKSKELKFASAPERVNPGDKVWNQGNTPRLVGGIDSGSLESAVEFYQQICKSVVTVSSPEIAEAAKLLENTFRLVNIALVDELAQACSAADLSVYEVITAASTKPYGFMPFYPGVGIGGHCIPVDPAYLTSWADTNGVSLDLTKAASRVSRYMPTYVAQRAISLVTGISHPKVLILGVAYKPGVADVRETPANELKKALEELGAQVFWHDPLVAKWEGTTSVDLNMNYDVAILATNQPSMQLNLLNNDLKPLLDCTNSKVIGKKVFNL